MNNKYIYLLLFLVLSLVIISGCNNDESSVMELKPMTEFNEELDSGLSIIETNWQATQHESLGDINDVYMAVEEGSVSSLGLNIIFENKSNKQIIFGEDYTLEKKSSNIWYEVPALVDDSGLSELGYELSFLQTRKIEVDWKWLYGAQDPGEYRIIKDIMDFRGSGCYGREYLATEFVVE